MTKLLQSELQKFQAKFYSFGDALVKSVNFNYEKNEFRVEIEAQDSTCVPPRWRYITLTMEDCFSMKTIHGNAAYGVLSLGLYILFEKESVGLEFGNFGDTPESMEELMTSPFHVVGKFLYWQVNNEGDDA